METAWIDDQFDVVLVRNKMRQHDHKFLALFSNLMDEIRMLAIRYSDRKKELETKIEETHRSVNKRA